MKLKIRPNEKGGKTSVKRAKRMAKKMLCSCELKYERCDGECQWAKKIKR